MHTPPRTLIQSPIRRRPAILLQQAAHRRDFSGRKFRGGQLLLDLDVVRREPIEGAFAHRALRLRAAEHQRLELPRHILACRLDTRERRRPVRQPHVHAESRAVAGFDRKRMSLLVTDHLYGVFGFAQD